jgi:hypothetical protein
MTDAPRPTWLARPDVGLAHAFMRDERPWLVNRSVCGHVERQDGLEWEAAAPERARCGTCRLRLRSADKARARADKEGL